MKNEKYFASINCNHYSALKAIEKFLQDEKYFENNRKTLYNKPCIISEREEKDFENADYSYSCDRNYEDKDVTKPQRICS